MLKELIIDAVNKMDIIGVIIMIWVMMRHKKYYTEKMDKILKDIEELKK